MCALDLHYKYSLPFPSQKNKTTTCKNTGPLALSTCLCLFLSHWQAHSHTHPRQTFTVSIPLAYARVSAGPTHTPSACACHAACVLLAGSRPAPPHLLVRLVPPTHPSVISHAHVSGLPCVPLAAGPLRPASSFIWFFGHIQPSEIVGVLRSAQLPTPTALTKVEKQMPGG